MFQKNREIWIAVIAILVITILYLFMLAWLKGVPQASDYFGHTLGILGFVLMLMTETLYSLRKRSNLARWGRMSDWLSFHIFTGIVGPYLVLLHTSWKFNGLAGITTLMTIIVVISGFVGRYIYTSIPRTSDGLDTEEIQSRRRWLSLWYAAHIPISIVLFTVAFIHIYKALYYATFLH